jgi:tetratricopeptide (TPR) repeat protein
MNRHERRAAVRKSQKASTGSSADGAAAALCAEGVAHMQAARWVDAQLCCQKALEIQPDRPDTLHLMGCLALESGQNDHAAEWFARAIRQAAKAEYMSSLGTALQRLGRLEEAVKFFDKAVQLKPDDAPGWKNLANVLFDLRQMDVALLAYRRVLSFDPRDWDAACRSGYLHYQAGQLEAALAQFGICDELRPNHAPTLYLRSVFLHDLGRFGQAVAEGTRAHELDPSDADTCNAIGAALQRLHRHEEALLWFDRALALKPDFDGALYSKAVSLGRLWRFDEALAIHDRLQAALRPDGSITDLKLADLLIDLGRPDAALAALDRCVDKRPDHAPTLQLRAVCLHGLRQLDRSLADSQRAHALDPTNAGICNNIGGVLHELGRYEDALRWLEMAIDLKPDYVDALNNKALAQAQLDRLAEAGATFDYVRAIAPNNAEAALGAANLQLLHGNFEAGWAGREARWNVPNLPIVYPKFPQPMWRGGSSIAGKTILIYADEGMGDAIQFARYLPMVAALGARVILRVHEALKPLLADVAGVSLCLANNSTDAMPAFDTYCPMLSLPLAFGTRLDTIPAETPYLLHPAAHRMGAWNDRLGRHESLRVGLVWSGNPNHTNDLNRSIPLGMLTRLLDVDATFVSLQKDLRLGDRSILAQTDIVDLTADLTDFAETAALLCCLDLVITVDTSVAHLAATLGRPTWVLLPNPPDYRWLLNRDDSPWYPTARLFRQTETREYTSVLDRVRTELVALAAGFRGRAAV